MSEATLAKIQTDVSKSRHLLNKNCPLSSDRQVIVVDLRY